MLLAYTTYFLAFPVMELVDINALYATVPLFVMALAGPLLGEKITKQRWVAVAVGFAGVLIMVRPGASVFEPSSLLPILSALAYAYNPPTGVVEMIGEPSKLISITPPHCRNPRSRDSAGISAIPAAQT